MTLTRRSALLFALASSSALAPVVTLASDRKPVDEVVVQGSHLEQTSRCNKHGALRILASDSRLLIAGDCTAVVVIGARNFIQVEHADVIRMRGSLNSVLYQDSGTRVDDRGNGNTVAPKWPQ